MATALELVVRAYKALTVVGTSSATAPTPEQRNDGLVSLNAMLDSWSNENLYCYRVNEAQFTLQIGVSSYTVGTGGVINTPRPLRVIQAYIQDGGGNNYSMNIRTLDWWNQIGNRSSIITNQIPTDCYYDPQYPLGVFSVWPWPLTNYSCFFDTYQAISNLSTLTTTLQMPPGYERAIVYNLAIEISASQGIPLPTDGLNIPEIASKAIIAIKTNNDGNREIISMYDGAIVSHAYATYNPYSDSVGRGNLSG